MRTAGFSFYNPSSYIVHWVALKIRQKRILCYYTAKMKKYGYTKGDMRLFRRLNTPAKIQDWLDKLQFNFEKDGDTCMSPREVIKNKKAQCIEGAIFAAAVLEFHGGKPLVMDLRSVKKPYDDDHVVTIFKQFGCYGAISKTNHAVLRYREPIYKTVRELALSYFHEYFLNNGQKTLREYSEPFDLNYFNKLNWRTTDKPLLEISFYLDKIKHHKILLPKQVKNLRKADKIEIDAGKLTEYEKN